MIIGSIPIEIINKNECKEVNILVNVFYGYIYGIIDKITGKIVYIGQSRFNFNSYRKTIWRSKYYFGSGTIIKRYLKKHGINSLFKFIIDNAENQEDLDKKEKYYIKYFNTKIPNGWNISEGGSGYHRSWGYNKKGWHQTKEAKQKISEAAKRMWDNPEISEVIREKLKKPNTGQFKKGHSTWNKGLTKEVCPKLAKIKFN